MIVVYLDCNYVYIYSLDSIQSCNLSDKNVFVKHVHLKLPGFILAIALNCPRICTQCKDAAL